MMFQKPHVPDRTIQQKVTAQLTRRGVRPPSDVHVAVRNGAVTLSGKIEFEMQRKAAVHAASAVNGVQRVVDQLTVMRNTIGGWHSNKPQAHTTRPSPPASSDASKGAEQQSSSEAPSDAPARPSAEAEADR